MDTEIVQILTTQVQQYTKRKRDHDQVNFIIIGKEVDILIFKIYHVSQEMQKHASEKFQLLVLAIAKC